MQDSTERARKLILKQLNKKRPEFATIKTPYWEKTLRRPTYRGNPAILSYEVYSLKTYPDEATTVRILNDLVEEGKAHLFFAGEFAWYAKT